MPLKMRHRRILSLRVGANPCGIPRLGQGAALRLHRSLIHYCARSSSFCPCQTKKPPYACAKSRRTRKTECTAFGKESCPSKCVTGAFCPCGSGRIPAGFHLTARSGRSSQAPPEPDSLLRPFFILLPLPNKKAAIRRLFGRGRRTRTLKNGFGDRYVTITSCPYGGWKPAWIIVPNADGKCKHFLYPAKNMFYTNRLKYRWRFQ